MEDLAWVVAAECPKGWASAGVRRVVGDAAWILSCDETAALAVLKRLAAEAADYALALGSKDVAGRSIDRDAWDNFRLLCRQADIALALTVANRTG